MVRLEIGGNKHEDKRGGIDEKHGNKKNNDFDLGKHASHEVAIVAPDDAEHIVADQDGEEVTKLNKPSLTS